MAYATKFLATIVDRFKKVFKIELKKKDYFGSVTTIDKAGANAVLSYRGDRDTDENILPSDVGFNFYVKREDNNKFDELFESEYRDWILQVTAGDRTLTNQGYGLDYTVPSASMNESSGNKQWSFTNSPGENKPFSLSMTNTGNNYTLRWSNPSYNFTPQSFLIVYRQAQYYVSTPVNGSNLTSYTFTNLGDIADTYKFMIAACRQPNGVQPAEFSNRLSKVVTNLNKPYNVSAVTSGSSIRITWANPNYSFPVQSFSFNRVRRLPNGDLESTGGFTLNNDGTATSAIDLDIGLEYTGATYKYQIGVAALPDGFDTRVVSDFSNLVTILNPTTPAKIWFTGNHLVTNKYLGSQKISPELRVSGGSGAVIVKWEYVFTGGTFTINESQRINATGGSFTTYLTGHTFSRNYSNPASKITGSLRSGATFTVGGLNTNIVRTIPVRSKVATLNAIQSGDNVNLSWSQISDANADYLWGYLVGRYNNVGDLLVETVARVSGVTSTSYSVINAPKGAYTYYVNGISFSNSSTDPESSETKTTVITVV